MSRLHREVQYVERADNWREAMRRRGYRRDVEPLDAGDMLFAAIVTSLVLVVLVTWAVLA